VNNTYVDRGEMLAGKHGSSSYHGGATLTSVMREQQRRAEENLYDCPRSLLAASYSTTSDHQNESTRTSLDQKSSQRDREYDGGIEATFFQKQRQRYSAAPSISLGVWGEGRPAMPPKERPSGDFSSAKSELEDDQQQLYAQPRQRQLQLAAAAEVDNRERRTKSPPAAEDPAAVQQPGRVMLSRKVSGADMLLPAAHWLRPELKPKPIEIRYRNGSAKASI
jgi:hypothetical protein